MGFAGFTYSSEWLHHLKMHHRLSHHVTQGETAETGTEVCERKIAARKAQICAEKIHQYFEQKSDRDNIMYHMWLWTLLFLKVSGVKVQTKIDKYFTPMG
jgi:hypothetical protein